MNTGGFDIDNYHDGDTTIIGSLSVSGNITIGGASGQSEYLDSGDYNTIVSPGGIAWNTLTVKPGTSARYAKNGNIVQFYATLRGNLKANQPSAVLTLTVPAFDLFSVLPLSFGTVASTFLLSDGSVFNGSVSSITTTGNITSIILFYIRSSGSNITTIQDFDITLTYKLVGEDVPATALLVGGSGGGGGGSVQNPMINNLDGGGFNLTNFGDIQSTTFNGGVILTNPLSENLNLAGFNIYNVEGIETEIIKNFVDGAPVLFASNIDMEGNNILAVSALSATDIKTTSISSNDETAIIFNDSIDFKSGGSIIGCIDIKTNSIGLNGAPEITINGDVSLSGNNLSGCNDIKINSITLNNDISGAISVNANMNMVGNVIFGAQDILTTKIDAEILNITSKLELFGTGVITNAISTQTTDLKVSNIRSDTIGVPTAPVNFLNNIDMKSLYSINNVSAVGVLGGVTSLATQTTDLKVSNIRSNTDGAPADPVNFLNNIDMKSLYSINNVSAVGVLGGVTSLALLTGTINGIKYIRSIDDITPTFAGIYVVCALITIPSSITFTTTGDTSFIGYDREATGFIFNNPTLDAGFCLTSLSHNVSFINMRISNISSSRSLFGFNDPPKLKKITMLNSLFINCKNQSVVQITGYDLVDINQTVFELCFPTIDHLTIIECDKIQISNCTLYKSIGNFGSFPGTAPLILLAGVCGLVNINGTCINTQATQDGIKIENSFNATRALIGGNTLQSTLSTGQLLNYNANLHPNLLVSDNAGVRDNRTILSAQSFGNITYTPTVLNDYQPINFGLGFTVLSSFGFSAGVEPFSFLYNRTQPIDVVVSANLTSDHDTAGTDVIRIALFKNNNIVSFAESESESKIATPISYNAITTLNFNDVLIFKALNLTAGTSATGYRCTSFNGTLAEA